MLHKLIRDRTNRHTEGLLIVLGLLTVLGLLIVPGLRTVPGPRTVLHSPLVYNIQDRYKERLALLIAIARIIIVVINLSLLRNYLLILSCDLYIRRILRGLTTYPTLGITHQAPTCSTSYLRRYTAHHTWVPLTQL